MWREVVGSDLPLDEAAVAAVWRTGLQGQEQEQEAGQEAPVCAAWR